MPKWEAHCMVDHEPRLGYKRPWFSWPRKGHCAQCQGHEVWRTCHPHSCFQRCAYKTQWMDFPLQNPTGEKGVQGMQYHQHEVQSAMGKGLSALLVKTRYGNVDRRSLFSWVIVLSLLSNGKVHTDRHLFTYWANHQDWLHLCNHFSQLPLENDQ